MTSKTTTETTKKTAAKATTGAPKSEKGRVLKRKPRVATPKAKTAKAATKGKESASAAKKEIAAKAPKPEKIIIPQSLADLQLRFCEHLRKIGKSEGTARSYAADLSVACKHFGEEKLVAKITKPEAQAYLDSERVNLGRDGKKKNQITIDKVLRVFRQAIDFAVADGWMKTSPLPDYERKSKKALAEKSEVKA